MDGEKNNGDERKIACGGERERERRGASEQRDETSGGIHSETEVCIWDRQTDRQTDRDRETETRRQTETDTDRERDTQRARDRETQRHRDRETGCERTDRRDG